MEYLKSNKGVVSNQPARDKGTLVLANDLRENMLDSVCYSFGNDFLNDIA
jgi:hypothetical protein